MLTPNLTIVFRRLQAKARRGEYEAALLHELSLIDRNAIISEQVLILNRTLPPGPVATPSTCGCCGQDI
jgi:hypothetical protein